MLLIVHMLKFLIKHFIYLEVAMCHPCDIGICDPSRCTDEDCCAISMPVSIPDGGVADDCICDSCGGTWLGNRPTCPYCGSDNISNLGS